MNFIYKKHIPFIKIGQHGSQVPRFFKHRPRSAFNGHFQLISNDVRQVVFPKPGGPKTRV